MICQVILLDHALPFGVGKLRHTVTQRAYVLLQSIQTNQKFRANFRDTNLFKCAYLLQSELKLVSLVLACNDSRVQFPCHVTGKFFQIQHRIRAFLVQLYHHFLVL